MVFGSEWPVAFNTKILEKNQEKIFLNNEKNLSVLYIKEEDKFFQKLEEYLKEEEKFSKRINRGLFKLNDGVSQTEDYNIEGEANIKDVSMPFIFDLNIFISLLQRKGMEEIKVVSYLPVSYLARDITATTSSRREEQLERNQRIQENQTNKLIRTFRRLCAQNTQLKVRSLPYEVDEFLTLSLEPRRKELDNMLIEESNKRITEEIIK